MGLKITEEMISISGKKTGKWCNLSNPCRVGLVGAVGSCPGGPPFGQAILSEWLTLGKYINMLICFRQPGDVGASLARLIHVLQDCEVFYQVDGG